MPQGPAYSLAMPDTRPLRDSDRTAVSAVAVACDEVGPVSAGDPRYLAYVSSRGRLAVSEDAGTVVAYGGVVDLRDAAFLTDLFVAPQWRGAGHGGALLADLWGGTSSRATSSSQDPRALASYGRFGATPRWPLLYLEIPGATVSPQVPVVHADPEPGDAGWELEVDATRTVRVVAGPGASVTTAVVRNDGDRWSVLRATTPDARGLAVLVADLRSRAGESGVVTIAVPGPHPGLVDVLACGARVVGVDLWCATQDAVDIVDPLHELPSPALG